MSKIRAFGCLVVVCVVCVSCQREANDPQTSKSAAALVTNAVSKVDDKGRLSESAVYETNASLKQRTFYERAPDGRILAARTVDSQGKPKWTEQYFYGEAGNQRPVEIRRQTADGRIFSVRVVSSPDGTERRIVTGPDGKPIPESQVSAFLEE